MDNQESNLYPVRDLVLKEKDLIFTVYRKDIIKSRVSRKMRKGKSGIIESEYCYCLPEKIIKKKRFYQNQLPNARYIKKLCILNNERRIVQEIPILRVLQSRSGALNFGIDRSKFTEEVNKYIRKEECNE
ncbi:MULTISPECIES: hypothetical protein [Enterococcus]|uniref:Uncharacterized protein n=1 Tax=Enterococcus faecium TaxID=1352 RepID=A0AB37HZ57_ENTFC|nr:MULTISPECIES: hypothetical protein [Enterococcus]EGP5619864.1 hypothetical protein [Enterococcus faecium]EME8088285.1 hypothetical protein [Enterococcus faecium]EMF0485732.1 hypothetical protein [Enterococcus hirae]MBO1101781.1 hypothetical protein [Enterococcus hirae]PQH00133.1 hypothetical protein CUS52_02990 [Enterococcus faecium]